MPRVTCPVPCRNPQLATAPQQKPPTEVQITISFLKLDIGFLKKPTSFYQLITYQYQQAACQFQQATPAFKKTAYRY